MCQHHRNISTSNPEGHRQDHKQWSRRNFLGSLAWALGGTAMLSSIPVKAIGGTLLNDYCSIDKDRILVLIRFKGGNDGLNTFIPVYDYGFYQKKRPHLALDRDELIALSPEFSIPDYMSPLRGIWNQGAMKVINAVGYPDANLSHFRSTDIWSSASDAHVIEGTGWMGRTLETRRNRPENVPPAVIIGGERDMVFKGKQGNMGLVVQNARELYEVSKQYPSFPLDGLPNSDYGKELAFLRSISNSTIHYGKAIHEAHKKSSTHADYKGTGELGRQLKLVARLIKGGLGSKLYMVSLDGFDTHAHQRGKHAHLMRVFSKSIATFLEDIKSHSDKVLAMTFSEFGRRIEQNGSRGTDHGTAAPVMLFGNALNGNGFIGTKPDLRNPDDHGNLRHTSDFRQVYSSILQDWTGLSSSLTSQTLGRDFGRIQGLFA